MKTFGEGCFVILKQGVTVYFVAYAGLKLVETLLFQPPKCWHCRHAPSHPAKSCLWGILCLTRNDSASKDDFLIFLSVDKLPKNVYTHICIETHITKGLIRLVLVSSESYAREAQNV